MERVQMLVKKDYSKTLLAKQNKLILKLFVNRFPDKEI